MRVLIFKTLFANSLSFLGLEALESRPLVATHNPKYPVYGRRPDLGHCLV